MDDYSKSVEQWKSLVGGFILSFGDIEAISYGLWRRHCGSRKPPEAFRTRSRLLIERLNESGGAENIRIAEILGRSLEIADKRNTVAHNPLRVQVYEHTASGALWRTELGITSRMTDAFIDDAELKEVASETEELVADLLMITGMLDSK